MNKEYRPVNNTFREHWKIHGYLSPTMIEELLDLVDDMNDEITKLTKTMDELEDDVRRFSNAQILALEDEVQELR